MIPPHFFYQIYPSSSGLYDCTPTTCDILSKYTDSADIEVDDLSSGCMNGSDVNDRCEHDTRQLHSSNLVLLISQDELTEQSLFATASFQSSCQV